MPRGYFVPFTENQEQKIKDEFLIKPIKKLARELGTTNGRIMRFLQKNDLVIPKHIIEKRKKDSQKKKGDIPFNKGKKQTDYMSDAAIEKAKLTQFKKGNKPHNTKFNGHERVTKDGYIEIRISKGFYKLKHLHNWELINGELPGGHCLKCLDGNKQNTDPSNWNLISRAENMLRNSRHSYPEEVIPSMVLLNQITNKLNTLKDG